MRALREGTLAHLVANVAIGAGYLAGEGWSQRRRAWANGFEADEVAISTWVQSEMRQPSDEDHT